jgi:ABC-type multidrug transport system fused ATPase/permease subunit
MAFRGVSFVYLTENLGYYLKNKAFKVSINRPMKEVDEIGKQKLAHIVNTNCEDLKHLGGHHLADINENLMTILVGLGIAFAFSWAITLIALGLLPLVLLSGKMQMSFNHGMSSQTDKLHKKTHELIIDTILNYKTVRSLGIEKRIL